MRSGDAAAEPGGRGRENTTRLWFLKILGQSVQVAYTFGKLHEGRAKRKAPQVRMESIH